jgi:hypothetical protein
MVHAAEPPVLVVVGAGFFFLAVVVVPAVDAGAFGDVSEGIDTAVAALVPVSPLESEPQPARASSAAAPSITGRNGPTRIGPGM